jgi:hypothetical protein
MDQTYPLGSALSRVFDHAVVISSAINGSHEIVPRTLFSYRYPLFLLFDPVPVTKQNSPGIDAPGLNFTCIKSNP